MNKKFILNISISFFIIAVFTSIYIFKQEYLKSFDNKIIDTAFLVRGEIEPKNGIIIADIDEQSLKKLGQWPWQRNKIAQITQNIADAGAYAIGFDVVFAEEDDSSPDKILKEYGFDYSNAPNHDDILASVFASTPTIAGYLFNFKDAEKNKESVSSSLIVVEKNIPKGIEFFPVAKSITRNIDKLDQNVYSSGFFNTFPDGDGIVRSVPLLARYNNRLYPSLSLELVNAVLGNKKIVVNYSDVGVDSINVGEISIPTDRHGRLFVNYRGGSKKFEYISMKDIYENKIDKNKIEGKIVLIGTSALGLLDLRATPFESTFAGVEIHANAIDNILNGDFISRPSWVEAANIACIILFGFLMMAIFAVSSGFLTAILSGSLMAAFLSFFYYMLFFEGILLAPIFSIGVMSIIFATLMVQNYIYEMRQKEFIKDKFSKKVSPQVAQELIKNGGHANLEGDLREITIFFSDIRGFTSISEQFGSPKKLVSYLNRYMTPMAQKVIDTNGTIDKFIGDAIMAYWNAPNFLANHQDAALGCALSQLEELGQLNKIFEQESLLPIKIGIGIDTGPAVVGEMGSQGRSDYTVIGDSVNLASRLEGLNKYYGTQIIISQDLLNGLKEKYVYRKLDKVMVKGKHEAVVIYEVLQKGEADEELAKELLEYENALALYENTQLQEAQKIFENLMAKNNLKIYDIYLERIQEDIKNLQSGQQLQSGGVHKFETK